MKTLDEIKKILSSSKKDLAREFKVKGLGIFGSYLRNAGDKGSDLDMLVDFENPPSLLTFIALEKHM